ncbi:unnamed protein product [Caretta caretta]
MNGGNLRMLNMASSCHTPTEKYSVDINWSFAEWTEELGLYTWIGKIELGNPDPSCGSEQSFDLRLQMQNY